MKLSEILAALKKIENICLTQHWTADRRWKIEQIARDTRRRIEIEIAASGDKPARND